MKNDSQSPTIDPQAFGKFQGSMETNMQHVNTTLTKFTEKLDKLVTHEQLETVVGPINDKLDRHEKRIESVEGTLLAQSTQDLIERASLWTKIKASFESNFVKFVAGALFLAALIIGVNYALSQYQVKPPDVINITK